MVQAENDPAKYIIENGKRRWIPDMETFNIMGLNESMVQYISKQDLQEITQGEQIPSKFMVKIPLLNKVLYNTNGDPKVYIMINNTRRHIPDIETLQFLGYTTDMIQNISNAEMATISLGAPLPSRKDRTILKAANENYHYVLENGITRLIPDTETFDAMQLNRANIITVSKQDITDIPAGPAIVSMKPTLKPLVEKVMYQVPGEPAVYLVLNKTLRHVPDPETLAKLGYDYSMVQNVSRQELATLPMGKVLPQRVDNTLLQAINEPAVYIMQFGVRRWIPDGETFNAMKLDWGKIKQIDKKDLTDIPEGPAITSIK